MITDKELEEMKNLISTFKSTPKEPKEGCVEVKIKYKGIIYGLGLELKDFPTMEALTKGMRWLSFCTIETLKRKYYFAETFDMDSCEHRRGDPDCCSHEVCDNITDDVMCKGFMHYQPVYGGYYYECDKCGRTK